MNAFDELEYELRAGVRRAAAAPSAAAPAPERVRPRRHRPGGLAIALAALVVCGSAAAAVVSLTRERSEPLAGHPPALGGARYRVELRPDLSAGAIGWCTTIVIRAAKGPTAGTGCGPAAAEADALIAAGGLGGRAPGVAFAIVDHRAATVRFGDRHVVPIAYPTLPTGWRAAVTIVHGDPAIVAEAATGHPLARTELAGTRRAGTQALPTRAVDPNNPPRHPCALRARGLPGLRAISARLSASRPSRTPDVNGSPFLSCATTVFSLDGQRLRAARLLDARTPHRPAALLPGMRAPRTPHEIVSASGLISARRVGPGWIVVYGPTATARARLLRALRVG